MHSERKIDSKLPSFEHFQPTEIFLYLNLPSDIFFWPALLIQDEGRKLLILSAYIQDSQMWFSNLSRTLSKS